MIIASDIAYVRYQVKSLDAMESFLTDFGLHKVQRSDKALYMRSNGSAYFCHVSEIGAESRTIGFGVLAQSYEDLERLASETGTEIEELTDPGAGYRVRLADPAGFEVDVIFGQQSHEPLPMRDAFEFNSAYARNRKGQAIRQKPAVAGVVRLGHLALLVPDHKAAIAFYTDTLGFKISDSYYAGSPDNKIASFLHCGLGHQFTDHHTLALITSPDGNARFDHSAFEVLDLDDLVQGHEFLKSKGHKHSWGIGRHIQGSQLFDYWRDPEGNKVEHWTDGDLVNDDTPVGNAPISSDELSQWAPPITPEFFA